MTRTPKEAAEGRLNLLVGGDAALFAECRPLLACFAENISHAGPVGAGHRMKLLHNYVSLGVIALLSEAAARCAPTSTRPCSRTCWARAAAAAWRWNASSPICWNRIPRR